MSIFKTLLYALRMKAAIRKANRWARLTNQKHMVININGHLRVTSKKTLKNLIHQRRFIKGTRIEDLEKRALYITK